MTPGSEAATRLLMEQVGHTVRAALRRRSGLTLAEDDARAENLDALDVYQDALVRVWERIGHAPCSGSSDVTDLRAFATAVANNLWSDYLRQKHPRRASLKNRLRYFLSHAPDFAVWEGPESTLTCGRKAWSYGTKPAASARVDKLSEDLSWLPAQAGAVERYSVADWEKYASALFSRAGGPLPFDDLVALTARVLEVREDRMESIDAASESERAFPELADPSRRTPDTDAELRGSIVRLWSAVKTLRADYRCAYLLNIPGPGKTRGDIEVFVDLGVARLGEIGATLALSDEQYALAWDALNLTPADRSDIAVATTAEEKFCLLWKYLPLGDALIARLLGIQQQHVINRRSLALRELARALSGDCAGRAE